MEVFARREKLEVFDRQYPRPEDLESVVSAGLACPSCVCISKRLAESHPHTVPVRSQCASDLQSHLEEAIPV